MSRWYDEHPRLQKGLDGLQEMDPEIRGLILNGIISLIRKEQPSLLDLEQPFDYRFDSYQMRWYDHDPFCWFVFNALERADISILKLVEDYFESKILLQKKIVTKKAVENN